MNLFCAFGVGEQFTRVVLAYAGTLVYLSLERTHGIIFVAGRRDSMSGDKVTSVRWSPAGFRLHPLKGADKGRWSVWVN